MNSKQKMALEGNTTLVLSIRIFNLELTCGSFYRYMGKNVSICTKTEAPGIIVMKILPSSMPVRVCQRKFNICIINWTINCKHG